MSRVRSRQGRYAEAERLLAQARKWATICNVQCAAGELALCRHRWDEAIRALSDLVEEANAFGLHGEGATRLLLLADAYAGRGEGSDLARAQELYRQALERFAAMPAPGWVRIIEARLQSLQATRDPLHPESEITSDDGG